MFSLNPPPTPIVQGIPPIPPHTQERRAAQSARRSARTHNPVQGPTRARAQGRTRGAANYRPREIEVLLDFVEADLPVGSKGWNTVGARYREWAAATEHPSRTDRSLEIKYKQVRPFFLLRATCF